MADRNIRTALVAAFGERSDWALAGAVEATLGVKRRSALRWLAGTRQPGAAVWAALALLDCRRQRGATEH